MRAGHRGARCGAGMRGKCAALAKRPIRDRCVALVRKCGVRGGLCVEELLSGCGAGLMGIFFWAAWSGAAGGDWWGFWEA